MPVGVAPQAVALELPGAGAVVDQQVAGRVVSEVFRGLVTSVAHAGQAVERVVLITPWAVARVADLCEVAIGAVGIIATVQWTLVLPDGMGLQTALLVVGIVAVQQTLLTAFFTTELEMMAGQSRAIQVDGRQRPTLGAVVFKTAVVRQTQVLELAADVVAITQGAPALMFGDQSVVNVVLELQRMVLAIIDADQSTQPVIAVLDLDPVGQGLDQ
ncbi:hypothetical protein D3C71_1584070 [compost metagenome]